MNREYCSYYGVLDDIKPIRSLSQDCVIEVNMQMFEELKEMESRIKRHITECKREIVKELEESTIKIKPKTKKENSNGSKN